MSIADNAVEIRRRVTEAAEHADRDPDDVTIIAVSKTFPREIVDEAYASGFRHFGENRLQEIAEKYAEPLPDDATIHMIGHLQSNKVRQTLKYVDVIQTVDRDSLLQTLIKEIGKTDRACEVLIEVNISGEEQKAGCDPDDASAILDTILTEPRLQPRGLMTMAPLGASDAALNAVFEGLRLLRDRLQEHAGIELPVLSMGMSDDFEAAIAQGATHVRIGRAIFGTRS